MNVKSIVSNSARYNILEFLNKHNPEVCLLGETKLNNSHKITFKDYNLIRNDRLNAIAGGGTAILIKRSINYEELNLNSNITKLYNNNKKQ